MPAVKTGMNMKLVHGVRLYKRLPEKDPASEDVKMLARSPCSRETVGSYDICLQESWLHRVYWVSNSGDFLRIQL